MSKTAFGLVVLAATLALSAAAHADVIKYVLKDVTFDDGGRLMERLQWIRLRGSF